MWQSKPCNNIRTAPEQPNRSQPLCFRASILQVKGVSAVVSQWLRHFASKPTSLCIWHNHMHKINFYFYSKSVSTCFWSFTVWSGPMWRGIVLKAAVLPRSQIVWATVYSAAARWSRFPFKIKQKAGGRRFGTAKKHCTQSDMWNPKPGVFSMGSMGAVTGWEVWVWWPIPGMSSSYPS